tara:strand:+ start:1897 stop:2349 length:453 start_codon:yes stop_codon:yes gene_type:complete
MNLTSKQEAFANLYIELGSASEAYRGAYDVGEDTKNDSVNTLAHRELNKVHVRLRVTELQNELGERFKLGQGYVIAQLLSVINDVNYTVDLAKLEKADSDETKRFYKLKEVTTNTDKLRAIDMLTKMLGLNAPDKIEQDIKIEIIEKKRD